MEASLLKKEDVVIPLAGTQWRYSAAEPYPPLSAILRAPIWSSDRYQALRLRLLSPIPKPEVRVGGSYVTVDLHPPPTATPTAAVDTSSPAPPDAEGPGEGAVSSTGRKAKRAAAPAGRFGLVHIAGFHHTSPLPADLSNIPYAALVVEVGEQHFTDGMHPQLSRLLGRGVPALVCGDKQDVTELLQFIKDAVPELHVTEMDLAKPTRAGDPQTHTYRFRRYRLVVLSRSKLTWKVCFLCCQFRVCTSAMRICAFGVEGSQFLRTLACTYLIPLSRTVCSIVRGMRICA